MRIDVVSIFPEYLAPLELSLIGKARQDGLLVLNVHDLRTFTTDKHRTVDDTPYGGGAGMVMKPEPWAQALESIASAVSAEARGPDAGSAEARGADAGSAATEGASDGQAKKPVLIVPSPAGERFNQALAYELAEEERLIFACGRYEGIDERVMEWAAGHFTVRPVSLGDYVLNGGEVAVLAMVEAIGRLLPGVVGNPESLVEESHSDGLLEYPVYTKPSSWRDRDVPAVLLSGNHGKIAQWRRHEQYRRTAERRPDLLADFDAGRLARADRTVFGELGYDVVDGLLRRRPDSGLED
jgi:tRNA (guanine37-N1)-methyltransferase